jgi:hypothetical protein
MVQHAGFAFDDFQFLDQDLAIFSDTLQEALSGGTSGSGSCFMIRGRDRSWAGEVSWCSRGTGQAMLSIAVLCLGISKSELQSRVLELDARLLGRCGMHDCWVGRRCFWQMDGQWGRETLHYRDSRLQREEGFHLT